MSTSVESQTVVERPVSWREVLVAEYEAVQAARRHLRVVEDEPQEFL